MFVRALRLYLAGRIGAGVLKRFLRDVLGVSASRLLAIDAELFGDGLNRDLGVRITGVLGGEATADR